MVDAKFQSLFCCPIISETEQVLDAQKRAVAAKARAGHTESERLIWQLVEQNRVAQEMLSQLDEVDLESIADDTAGNSAVKKRRQSMIETTHSVDDAISVCFVLTQFAFRLPSFELTTLPAVP